MAAPNNPTVIETTIDCSIPDTADPTILLQPAFEPTQTDVVALPDAAPPQVLSKTGESQFSDPRKGHLARMEDTYQTPTQVNQDRNYDEVFGSQDELVNGNVTKHTSDVPRTLEPDDTGAVDFGNLSPSSAVSEDKGFEDTRGAWRNDLTSQLNSNTGYTPHKPLAFAPTTPALPKNPFGPKVGVGAPMGATQIFGQTQFSSAVKKISPTSSRPSPNMLDSISTNLFRSSPSKKHDTVSSPSVIHPSSPTKLQDAPDTVLKEKMLETIEEESPSATRSKRADVVPQSPTYQPKPSVKRRLHEQYEPMDKSQEQSNMRNQEATIVEDDSDEEFRRRQEKKAKMAKQKARVAEEMSNVVIPPRISPDESKRKRRKLSDGDSKISEDRERPAEFRIAQSSPQAPRSSKPQNGDSSNADNVVLASGNEKSNANTHDNQAEAILPEPTPSRADARSSGQDIIPATPLVSSAHGRTGPAGSEPELPNLPEIPDGENSSSVPGLPSSAPPTKRRRQTYKARQSRRTVLKSSPGNELPATAPEAVSFREDRTTESGESADPSENEDSDAPRQSTKHVSELIPQTPGHPKHLKDVDDSSSNPSDLRSDTPRLSEESTPATKETTASRKAASVASTSPAQSHVLRRSRRAIAQSESPKPPVKAPKSTRQQRMDSESTDELHRGTAEQALKRAAIAPHGTNRASRTDSVPAREGLLFSGMIFGISLDPKQEQQKSQLVARIKQAGGAILREGQGLEELFEVPDPMKGNNPIYDEESQLRLKEKYRQIGFTAFLADSPSRKVKYMQALALGIPCLAYQWVLLCLAQNTILEWEPFLLPAGASAYLGKTILSRHLLPYDAEDACLAEVVGGRKRLMEGQSLLYVFDAKKSKTPSEQYPIFLAHALGPTITRVVTPQQARDILRERESSGNGFHYIYVDKDTCSIDAIFKIPGRNGRKNWAPWSFTVRELNDELITQSLIMEMIPSEEDIKIMKGV